MAGCSHTAKHHVRIIAGDWRGRLLPVLDIVGLRPTKNLIRETVFNWLQSKVLGACCLDAFAGTGALGFEALSRGAAYVTLLESDSAVAEHLRNIANRLQVTNVAIQQTEARLFVEQVTQSYDIIFLDPPFDKHLYESMLVLIAKRELLAEAGCIYIEAAKKHGLPVLPAGYQYQKQKCSGQVVYGLIGRCL